MIPKKGELQLEYERTCRRADLKYGKQIIDTIRAVAESTSEMRQIAQEAWDREYIVYPVDMDGNIVDKNFTLDPKHESGRDYKFTGHFVHKRWFHLFESIRNWNPAGAFDRGEGKPIELKIIVRKDMV